MRKLLNGMSVSLVGVAAAACLLSAGAFAEEKKGQETLTLSHIHATQANGSHFAAHDADCQRQLGEASTKYTGLKVTTDYMINTATNKVAAKSQFNNPDSSKSDVLDITLSALGLSENYSFGAFKPTALPNTYVLFSIEKDFTNPVSSILVLNAGKAYNCAISSVALQNSDSLQKKIGATKAL